MVGETYCEIDSITGYDRKFPGIETGIIQLYICLLERLGTRHQRSDAVMVFRIRVFILSRTDDRNAKVAPSRLCCTRTQV
jgi:hypothetical protein